MSDLIKQLTEQLTTLQQSLTTLTFNDLVDIERTQTAATADYSTSMVSLQSDEIIQSAQQTVYNIAEKMISNEY